MADAPAGAPRGVVRKRTTGGGSSNSSRPVSRAGGGSSNMLKMYTDDAPGLKVDPVVVVVLSLAFIGSVFILHIYGKFTRN
ncbi:1328_t:CDS:2 [Ambispora gerdemannii]|uniref:Protein transport protein Sec61 subunit beta n=1 Tax=Ambispora gerdemannii TaxID=144530 RepID=A0A9N8VU51_9GLOM|nr:1328_t:CDS:2 [Ambispora gerdemannii]